MQRPDPGLSPLAVLSLKDGSRAILQVITTPLAADLVANVSLALAAMDPWRRYGIAVDRLASFVSPGAADQPRYLVTLDNEIAGLVALKLGWMFGTYLNLLAVLPQHQRRGIGSATLVWLDAFGRARKERNQFVVTSAFNASGLALYQRHGFVEIARMPGLIEDAETEILMRKQLS